MRLEEAIDIFTGGFSFTRSFTHPYVVSRCGPLWVMQDAPRRSGDLRRIEMVTFGVSVKEVDEAIGEFGLAQAALCWIVRPGDDRDAIKEGIKSLGYRMIASEPFFLHDLANVPVPSDPRVRRVLSVEDATAVNQAARARQILIPHLREDDSPIRLYSAFEGGVPVGWVKSVRGSEHGNWVSNLFVAPGARRQGLGTALMLAMLQDDARLGTPASALLASTAGSKLYPTLGYRQIGELLLFVPRT